MARVVLTDVTVHRPQAEGELVRGISASAGVGVDFER